MKKGVKGIELRRKIQIGRSLESIGWQMKYLPMPQTIPAHVYLIRRQCQDRA